MAPRHPCMVQALVHRCMAVRHPFMMVRPAKSHYLSFSLCCVFGCFSQKSDLLQEAEHHTMALRPLYMMEAGPLARVELGIRTIPTHHPGKKESFTYILYTFNFDLMLLFAPALMFFSTQAG